MKNIENQTVNRLQNYLTQFGRKFPFAWQQFDSFRADRNTTADFEWNDWCFCPLAASYAIISNGGAMNPFEAINVGILGGLGAWRATQGIYKFDETVFESVWNTEMSGDIPADILYRLPEWCCYIETPGKTFGGEILHGFFVFLDDDRQNLRDELRFILDTENRLVPIPFHLSKTTVNKSLKSVIAEADFQAKKLGFEVNPQPKHLTELGDEVQHFLNLVLYLCSQNAEIPNFENRDQPNYNPKKKRLFPPAKPRTWEVAFRLGAKIRQAQSAEAKDSDSNRNSPRPHIRKAHWHGFWSGKRSEKQKFELKWLPPIAVNVDDAEIIPTIHEVKN